MDYNVQVCDWTQVIKEGGCKYGVSVNSEVVYESDNIDECLNVKWLIIKGFNAGVTVARLMSQRAIESSEVKGSIISDKEVLTVTPEMQRKAKGN